MASRRLLRIRLIIFLTGILAIGCGAHGAIADFDDLSLAAESYWNGSDGSGGFVSGSAHFNNTYDDSWGSWEGFAYSNITDTATDGAAGQYNAITGLGQGGSANYGVGYEGWVAGPPTVTLDSVGLIEGLYVTNTNFGYYSMLNGDLFAKKFGGTSGDEEDWFMLTITGKDAAGAATGSVDFYLADYRFTDNALDYIVDSWDFIDLTSLGSVKSLEFDLNSSDVGAYGMNTPASFALDSVVPEPATIALLGLGGLVLSRRRK
ncbi:MAG: DUF4465 domain-containing protein [Planctomycetota bacterium]